MNKIISGALLAATMVVSGVALAATTANPTSLTVKLYKTEVFNGSSWVTVMSDSAGVSLNLLGNAGTAFGSGSVDAGTYTMVRFTIQNQITYGYAAFATADTCAANAAATFSIDGSQGATAQVGLSFGTNGGVGWRANGTDAFPYLMTQPILVGDGATTNVKLAFKTANMVSCSGSVASLTPPSFDVVSVLKPATAAFTGGDYWIVGLSKNTTNRLYNGATVVNPEMFTPTGALAPVALYDYLLNSTATTENLTLSAGATTFGPYSDVFNTVGVTITVGEYFRQQVRNNSSNELRWGMKVRFTPDTADPSIGTVEGLRGNGKHRHQLDESWDTANSGGYGATAAPGTDLGTPITVGTYTLDASNRFTITTAGDIIKGAFDKNYEVLTAANISRPNGDAELTVGVKVQTGATGPIIPAPTVASPVTISWMSYDWEFQRLTAAGATANGAPWAAKHPTISWDSANVQYFNITVNGGGNFDMQGPGFRSAGRMDRPASMDVCNPTPGPCDTNPFWASTENNNNWMSMTNITPANYNTQFTPAGTDTLAGLLSGMDPANPPWVAYAPTTGTLAIASGTADLDAKWTVANEERHYLGYTVGMKQAPLGTHSNASVAGTYLATYMWDEVTSGNGQRRVGSGYAEMAMDGAGALTINVHEKENDGTVTNTTLNAAYSVQNICIGLSALAQEAATIADNGATVYPYNFTATDPTTGLAVTALDGAAARNIRDGVTNGPSRLSPTDATCAGGKKLQMILGYDPALGSVFASGNPKLVMMIGQTGDVLTFTDPKSFDNAGTLHRQLGLAIKLK